MNQLVGNASGHKVTIYVGDGRVGADCSCEWSTDTVVSTDEAMLQVRECMLEHLKHTHGIDRVGIVQ